MVHVDGLLSGFNPGTFATALVGAAALRVYDRRPRGFVNPSVRLLVAKSQVPGGGLGVFTEKALPAGTTLGAYPGRLLYSAEYSRKLAEHPRASSYCWKRQDGTVLDPTDRQGNIVEVVPLLEVGGGLGLGEAWGVPTTLARINEPPPRFDVNVDTEEQADQLLFLTGRACAAGEELFLDYGQDYDRSSYGRGDS